MARFRFLRGDLPADLVYLLTVTWGGKVYRWSTRPIDVDDADGNAMCYPGGLDLDSWSQTIDIGTTSPESRSVPVEVDWPGVAARVAAGHPLDTATAELALIAPGDDWDRRVVLLNGDVSEPEYGADGEPVAFSVVDEPGTDATLIPYSTQRVSSDTWAAGYDEDAEGLYYPWVYGEPGVVTDGSVVPGSPTLVVDRDAVSDQAQTLLIAGHEVTATTVTIVDDEGATDTGTVTRTVDLLGQVVSTVDVSGLSLHLEGASFWVAWTHGKAHPRVSGAGTLILELLRLTSLRVDDGRAVAACLTLDAYSVGGWIDEACSPWDHIQDAILPYLPVVIAVGVDGLYPLAWPVALRDEMAVTTIRVGAGIVRDGRIRYISPKSERVNELRLRYALDGDGGESRESITVSGDPTGDDRSFLSARVSETRYGTRAEEMDLPAVWTETTAQQVAAWLLATRALSPREVTVVGPLKELAWLYPGQVVRITDTSTSLDDLAIVTTVGIAKGQASVTVQIPEDPCS